MTNNPHDSSKKLESNADKAGRDAGEIGKEIGEKLGKFFYTVGSTGGDIVDQEVQGLLNIVRKPAPSRCK